MEKGEDIIRLNRCRHEEDITCGSAPISEVSEYTGGGGHSRRSDGLDLDMPSRSSSQEKIDL